MANPLLAQGVLNRLRASVVWAGLDTFNITPSFLGDQAIRLALEGEATTFIGTMTGAATSPEPYQMVTMGVHLLKTQNLAELYKRRMESNSLLGDCTVRPDVMSGGIGVYQLTNCAIRNVAELDFGGKDAGYRITIGGVYLINSSLWDV